MADTATLSRPTPATLPTTTEGWLLHRKIKAKPTINDLVEAMHLRLIKEENTQYLEYLSAVYPSESIEGSLDADDQEAARIIREKAREDQNDALSHQKLLTIMKALRVTLKRYSFSRKERRQMVGGVEVPDDDENLQLEHSSRYDHEMTGK